MGAALLGGAGSVLFAGSAQALSFAEWAGGTPLTLGDKEFRYDTSTGLPINTSNDEVSITFANGTYLFDYDFREPNFDTIANFTLNYTATVTNPLNYFIAVDIDSTVETFAPNELLTATYTGGTAPVVLQSINGDQNPAILPVLGRPTVLSVSNVYASNGGAISGFQNSYRQGTNGTTVPGPLPLVGAGMAFGFSRKLRSRIKARVQA